MNRREFLGVAKNAAIVGGALMLPSALSGCITTSPDTIEAIAVNLNDLLVNPARYIDRGIITFGYPEFMGHYEYKQVGSFRSYSTARMTVHKLHLEGNTNSPSIYMADVSDPGSSVNVDETKFEHRATEKILKVRGLVQRDEVKVHHFNHMWPSSDDDMEACEFGTTDDKKYKSKNGCLSDFYIWTKEITEITETTG